MSRVHLDGGNGKPPSHAKWLHAKRMLNTDQTRECSIPYSVAGAKAMRDSLLCVGVSYLRKGTRRESTLNLNESCMMYASSQTGKAVGVNTDKVLPSRKPRQDVYCLPVLKERTCMLRMHSGIAS